MKILLTGGCGYIGSALIPHVLANNHKVVCLDAQWFGNGFLPANENLTIHKADLRDHDVLSHCLKGSAAVIHLAGMTNDNECRKNPEEAEAVNFGVFESLVKLSQNFGVKRFIFPSSAAAYGNSQYPLSEDHHLEPATAYGCFKRDCEAVLKDSRLRHFILRPAGVFGYAPRMRFDLTVNMMTAHAALNGEILVAGGEQMRPHVHIRDLIDVILRLLTANIESDTFNIVYANQSVLQSAKLVKGVVEKYLKKKVTIETSERTDDRSYMVSAEKLRQVLSFECRRNIEDGVAELCRAFKEGRWQDALDNGIYSNVPGLVPATPK